MTPNENAVDAVKSLLNDATREADVALGLEEIVKNTHLNRQEAKEAVEALREGTHAQEGETLIIHHTDPPRYQFEAATG